MPIQDYLPKTDGPLGTWLTRYNASIQQYGASVGLSAAELSNTSADCAALQERLAAVAAAKVALKAAVAARKAAKATIVARLRRQNARLKTHPAYTSAIGKACGIVAAPHKWNAEEAKPELRLSMSGGKVVLRYRKEGSGGVRIWCRRGAEAEFTLLAQDARPPYFDTRRNEAAGAEQRSYYAYFIDKADAQVGRKSDVAVINV